MPNRGCSFNLMLWAGDMINSSITGTSWKSCITFTRAQRFRGVRNLWRSGIAKPLADLQSSLGELPVPIRAKHLAGSRVIE